MRIVTTFLLAWLCIGVVQAAGFADIISKVKPGIVGIGSLQETRAPKAILMGTGFVVDDGLHIVTNYHVVAKVLELQKKEHWVVFIGTGSKPETRTVEKVALDKAHDLALLKMTGKPLAVLQLADSSKVREGNEVLFTGFPIGAVLGLYPATHRAMISAITPIAIPVDHGKQLDVKMIRRLRDPYTIFQLDGTAYPGNSGSPVYDPESGRVIGVVNRVFVKETKEKVLSKPSGISYAIPSRYVKALLLRK